MQISLKSPYQKKDSALEQNRRHKLNLEDFVAQLNALIASYPDLSSSAQKDLSNVLNSDFLQKGISAGLATHEELLQKTISFATLENGKTYLVKANQDGTKTYWEFDSSLFAQKDLSNVTNPIFKAKGVDAGLVSKEQLDANKGFVIPILLDDIKRELNKDDLTDDEIKKAFVDKIVAIVGKVNVSANKLFFTDAIGIFLFTVDSYDTNTKTYFVNAISYQVDGFRTMRAFADINTETYEITMRDTSGLLYLDKDDIWKSYSFTNTDGSIFHVIDNLTYNNLNYIAYQQPTNTNLVLGKFTGNVLENQCISINQQGSGAIIASNQKYATFDEIVNVAKALAGSTITFKDGTTLAL